MALRAEVNRTSGETHHTRIPCSAFRGGPYQESLAGQDRLERPAVSFGFP